MDQQISPALTELPRFPTRDTDLIFDPKSAAREYDGGYEEQDASGHQQGDAGATGGRSGRSVNAAQKPSLHPPILIPRRTSIPPRKCLILNNRKPPNADYPWEKNAGFGDHLPRWPLTLLYTKTQ
jgi:hypothetical protein